MFAPINILKYHSAALEGKGIEAERPGETCWWLRLGR